MMQSADCKKYVAVCYTLQSLSSVMIFVKFVNVTFVWKFLNIHVLVQFGRNPLGTRSPRSNHFNIYFVFILLKAIIFIIIQF